MIKYNPLREPNVRVPSLRSGEYAMADIPKLEAEKQPLIRNISDTALWVAVYRTRETERPDALFRDPLARRLAGERGQQIVATMPFGDRNSWSFIARTCVFDRYIAEQVAQGTDM